MRGLRDLNIRREVFYHFRSKADILCLQETHSNSKDNQLWQNEFRGQIYWSNGESNARGTATCIPKESNITVKNVKTDLARRYVIVQFMQESTQYVFANIYAPNADKPQFFVEVFEQIMNLEGKKSY